MNLVQPDKQNKKDSKNKQNINEPNAFDNNPTI